MKRPVATFLVFGLVLIACGGTQAGATSASGRLPPAAAAESPKQTPAMSVRAQTEKLHIRVNGGTASARAYDPMFSQDAGDLERCS
jgi:hypothetical protein